MTATECGTELPPPPRGLLCELLEHQEIAQPRFILDAVLEAIAAPELCHHKTRLSRILFGLAFMILTGNIFSIRSALQHRREVDNFRLLPDRIGVFW